MRTNQHLLDTLTHYKDTYFNDVPVENNLEISFGKKAKRQLGCIKLHECGSSKITITKIFSDLEIPDYVVDETIVHEFIHYTHGFNSPLPQKFQHPHKHGIIRKEFTQRGLLELHLEAKQWLKKHWQEYLFANGYDKPKTRKTKKRTRRRRPKTPFQVLLAEINALLK